MGQYFDLFKQKEVLFEQHIIPAKVVRNLVLIVSSPETEHFTIKVRAASLKVLKFLCELDAHPEFHYHDIRDNPYFNQIVLHF